MGPGNGGGPRQLPSQEMAEPEITRPLRQEGSAAALRVWGARLPRPWGTAFLLQSLTT